jgi:hypothetical protein
MALRAKIGPDKAEAEGFGGSKVEADNAVWPDFRSQPEGTGPIFPLSSSIVARIRPVSVAPHSSTGEKLAPVAASWVV